MQHIFGTLLILLVTVGAACSGPDSTPTLRPTPTATATPQATPQAVILKQWQGAGAKNTEPFTIVKGPWVIRWDFKGSQFGILQIYVYRLGDSFPITIAANTVEDGMGNSYVYKVGDFYLQINAVGNWAISVIVQE